MNQEAEESIEITQDALESVPVFPLPGTVLLPRTLISLHVFEPRYRRMMEECIEGHRILAVAMLDEKGRPDDFLRPPILPVAGLGYLRRSARLPDGRYNIVLEGVARVDISAEYPPEMPFRRARVKVLPDVYPQRAEELRSAMACLHSLCTQAITRLTPADSEMLNGLNQVTDPGRLADMVAAATIQDNLDRQAVLAETNVLARLQLVSGSLGTMLLSAEHRSPEEEGAYGWGITPGKA